MKKILRVPYIDQTERWVYGCESISTVMLLQYLGVEVQPDEFIDEYLPRAYSTEMKGEMYAPDPTYYYINDPRDLTGWGCYAPCIVKALQNTFAAKEAHQRFAAVDETGLTAAQLCEKYIDNNMPVVFWATLDLQPAGGFSYWTLPSGQRFAWKGNEHCLLLVGYDEENFWFNDPWHNHGCCPYPRALVEQRHAEQGMYAVGVARIGHWDQATGRMI